MILESVLVTDEKSDYYPRALRETIESRLAVNEHFQTAVPHVYAVGDVIGFPALASTSMEQGRLAAAQISTRKRTIYARTPNQDAYMRALERSAKPYFRGCSSRRTRSCCAAGWSCRRSKGCAWSARPTIRRRCPIEAPPSRHRGVAGHDCTERRDATIACPDLRITSG